MRYSRYILEGLGSVLQSDILLACLNQSASQCCREVVAALKFLQLQKEFGILGKI